MKTLYPFIAFVFLISSVSAQISQGGHPFFGVDEASQLKSIDLPRPDIQKLRDEDRTLDQYEAVPYRFGANITVDLGMASHGMWTTTPGGDRVWRLSVRSMGAVSLNFRFDRFDLPDGARVFVYTPDQNTVLGGFTNANATSELSLGVGLVPGDHMIIEYFEPAEAVGMGDLHIDQITHGYRDIFGRGVDGPKGAFGNSGPCNINVNCPEGLPYDIQKRSVALIVNNGNAICSGALVNSTAQDGTPFFLTANHCVPGNANGVNNWIFYFNHEAEDCDGDDGPTNQSISGSTLLARNDYTDFALLELNAAPPASYDVCFSGWDATDLESTVTGAYGIHHPSGDVKKICFEEQSPYHAQVNWIDAVWFVDEWELGVTEGGSSGSPLFNQEGVIIGQLGGGTANCNGPVNNGGFDYYGRFGVSWSHGDVPANALRFWLDPGNTGTMIVPNSCGGALPDNDVLIAELVGTDQTLCSTEPFMPSVQVLNAGGNEVTDLVFEITVNDQPSEEVSWTGSVASGESIFITAPSIQPVDGLNEVMVEVISVNGGADANPAGNSHTDTFIAIEEPVYVDIHIVFDNYSEETGWNIVDADGNLVHEVLGYSGGMDEAEVSVCLAAECYVFTITDEYGDGICCNYGQGSYAVITAEGDTLASGGDFGDFESTDLCLSLGISERSASETMLIFPNPARNAVTIESVDSADRLHAVRVFDVQGRQVIHRTVEGLATVEMDLSSLQAGVYFVEAETERGFARQKLVVQ